MDIERLEHAKALRDSGQLEQALREFQSLAESTPDPEEKGLIILNEVGCLGGLGRAEEGRVRLGQAAELLAGTVEYDARIDLMSACLDSAEGNYKRALAKLDRIVNRYAELLLMPEVRDLYEELQWRRGMLMVQFERYQEARPILEEVLAFNAEKDGKLYGSLGICYVHLGEFERAKSSLLKALEVALDPQWETTVHYYLGQAHLHLGVPAWAKQELEKALALAQAAKMPSKHIYDALAKTCRALRLEDEGARYEKLAKESSER